MEEEKDFYEMLWQGKQSQELARLAACNEDTARFGLSLSQEEAPELAACRNESLRKWRRHLLTGLPIRKPFINQEI